MPNYLTPEGAKKLATELNQLMSVERPRIVQEVQEAAAQGDRSENAEYIYRKKQLREIDRRLRFLGKRLDIVAVIDPREQRQRERVFFGATVTVEDEDGVTATYRIIGADETGPAGDISWKSPIGRALLGKRLDDTVAVKWLSLIHI